LFFGDRSDASRNGARIRVAGVEAGTGLENRVGVADGLRKHRNGIERPARRHHAAGRDGAQARLQADDIV
jgi:hypothetical protein